MQNNAYSHITLLYKKRIHNLAKVVLNLAPKYGKIYTTFSPFINYLCHLKKVTQS